MKIIISFMVGLSISGPVPQMADGPPGMIVAPSGAVYKPEECGMDGNGDGWCAGEAVPAEYFIEKEKLKKNKKVLFLGHIKFLNLSSSNTEVIKKISEKSGEKFKEKYCQ